MGLENSRILFLNSLKSLAKAHVSHVPMPTKGRQNTFRLYRTLLFGFSFSAVMCFFRILPTAIALTSTESFSLKLGCEAGT